MGFPSRSKSNGSPFRALVLLEPAPSVRVRHRQGGSTQRRRSLRDPSSPIERHVAWQLVGMPSSSSSSSTKTNERDLSNDGCRKMERPLSRIFFANHFWCNPFVVPSEKAVRSQPTVDARRSLQNKRIPHRILVLAVLGATFAAANAVQASGGYHGHPKYKTVTVYQTVQVPYYTYVTKYHPCGTPYRVKVLRKRTAKVAVDQRIRIGY
jgi:hypothetical protein